MTLNGPSRIYHLKPVFQLPEHLELNSPMYKMKNLHQQSVAGKITAAADNTSNDQVRGWLIHAEGPENNFHVEGPGFENLQRDKNLS